MMIKSTGQVSLQGGREENQDAVLHEVLPNGWLLLAVCDGMGGLSGGRLASTIAVNQLAGYCRENYAHKSATQLLASAIIAANQAILNQSKANAQRMGTTVAALLLTPDAACIAHVGDSRIYQLRKGKLLFKTQDDSKAWLRVLGKELTEEEARTHEDSDVLTKALGIALDTTPTVNKLNYKKGDVFLLCSDGVWNLKPEKELLHLVSSEKDMSKMIPWLLNDLNQNAAANGGGHDNLSAIALMTASGSKTPANLRLEYLKWAVILLVGILSSTAFSWYYFGPGNQPTPDQDPSASQKHQNIIELLRDSLRLVEQQESMLRDSIRLLNKQESKKDDPKNKKKDKIQEQEAATEHPQKDTLKENKEIMETPPHNEPAQDSTKQE